MATGLSFTVVVDSLSTDKIFEGWEFGASLTTPALAGLFVAISTRSRVTTGLAVAYLTFFTTIIGPKFGSSGSEPLWQYAGLGLVGGLIWSVPFAVCSLMRKNSDEE